MKLVIFGLTVTSSWGNGHATLWRGLCRALAAMGHRVVFFEKDAPYYAAHRDFTRPEGWALCLYRAWDEVRSWAAAELRDADVGMVTSYCPDAVAASELVLSSPTVVRCFYDMDTPVTLERIERGQPVEYIGPHKLSSFDVVLSFTGGAALGELARRLGARRVFPLHGSVDPVTHQPVKLRSRLYAVSYLGTYDEDRQAALEELFFTPARRLPELAFVLGGSLYPGNLRWPGNVYYVRHVPPAEHARFYASSGITVNVTRPAMARMGYCPSGRLFEAAACAVPIVSDAWEGMERFFEPGREILIARSADEAVEVMRRPQKELARVGRAARARVLAEHTAAARARQLLELLQVAPERMSA